MIQHYFKTIIRHLNRQRGTTIVHMVGLTTGITCSLFIYFIIQFENSFDKFHQDFDRIYRVQTTKVESNSTYPGTPTGIVAALRKEVRGVESVAPVEKKQNLLVTIGKDDASPTRFEESVAFADSNFFDVFHFVWLSGDPSAVFQKPGEVVLSELYARKYFNSTDVLGKTIELESLHDLVVVGVIGDPPVNTDFAFNMIASYPTLKTLNANYNFDQWTGWSDSHQTFVRIGKNVTPEQINEQFPRILQKYKGKDALKERAHSLFALSKIHYDFNFSGRSANEKLIRILLVVGVFLLFVACINFINLTIAQAVKRAKEVGVRKSFGSSRKQLVTQFLLETCFISFLSIVLSLGVVSAVFPYLTALLELNVSFEFLMNGDTGLFILVLWLVTSLVAGFYPSIIIANQTPIRAMGKPAKNTGKYFVRNALMVVQFVISLILITSAIIITQQLQLFMNTSLGFKEDAIVVTKLPKNASNDLFSVRQQLLASPYIKQVSFSNNSPSSENNFMSNLQFVDRNQRVEIKTQMKFVDEHFLDLFEIQLIEGEAISEKDTTGAILINETMMQRMQLSSPRQAIGMKLEEGEYVYTVKGVVKDFHVNSLHQKIDPTILKIAPSMYYQANVQLNPEYLSAESITKTLKNMERLWENKFPQTIFNYEFLDEAMRKVYSHELQTAKLVKVATGIALLLSSLGLFGLAMFISAQRIKEIAVRKVFGATSAQIFILLSQSYVKLIFAAVIIATPITWWYVDQWLQNFAYRVEIEIWVFLTGILSIVVITICTLSYQLLKIALTNPANSLRDN